MKHSPNPKVTEKYAYRITDTVASTITGTPQNDPIARQYIPTEAELVTTPEEHPDPIGDDAHSPVKGIVHRYPDRVLFKPANICAVYCRYCFRREMVGPNHADILSDADIKAALNYIRETPSIWEVILTGGDPLILSPRQLSAIMQELSSIEHVKVIRFHTRIPIADPTRIKPSLINTLTQHTDRLVPAKPSGEAGSVCLQNKALYMALHINHADELTTETREAIHNLHRAGITLLSQSVLLKGVNDNPETLETLYRELVALNVKPYYLHHPDFAPGTSHFRLSIREGQDIVKALQGRLSGICQPTYMLDIPGGHGKIPLTPCAIKELENNRYSVENYKGKIFTYPPTS